MKKSLFLIPVFLIIAAHAQAEAIKLKNGMIINGSIVGQTEYVLSVKTNYGTIAINQREVDTIMPDLHRVLLRGGGEFVGTVLDLDEFNLSLKTDKGVVNIDVANIASMEIYDYDEAEKQQKYVEKKIELEQEALSTLGKNADASTTAATAASGSLSATGLSFDPDLEKAFPSKPVVVEQEQHYNYRLHTFQGEEIKEEEPAREEESVGPKLEEAQVQEQAKKKDGSKNFFALHAGGMSNSLKFDLSHYGLNQVETVDGVSMAFGATYMRRLTSRLWFGGDFTFSLIPKKQKDYDGFSDPQEVLDIDFSGQAYDISAILGFYVNPKSKLRWYFLGGGGLSALSLEQNHSLYKETATPGTYDWTATETRSLSSASVGAIFGTGLEYSIDDINIGVEVRGRYRTYSSDDIKESDKVSIYGALRANWFFY